MYDSWGQHVVNCHAPRQSRPKVDEVRKCTKPANASQVHCYRLIDAGRPRQSDDRVMGSGLCQFTRSATGDGGLKGRVELGIRADSRVQHMRMSGRPSTPVRAVQASSQA